MNRMLFGLAMVVVTAAAQAGPVDVPNSFQGGARALASEMNANFGAVESAIDDNAARVEALEAGLETANAAIDANSSATDDNTVAIDNNAADISNNAADIVNNAADIAALQAGMAGAGILVRVGELVAGRYVSYGNEPVQVEVAGTGGAETENVARRTALGTADVISVISPTGYFFALSTTDLATLPFGPEGTLAPLSVWFGTSDCTGQAYLAVEGPVGPFSTFEPGVSDLLPIKRWLVRQGFAFRSPDPTAVGEAYMVPRGQAAQQVTLNSLYRFSQASSTVTCLNLAIVPGYPGNEEHSAVLVEPLDPVETGIPLDLVGEITVGM